MTALFFAIDTEPTCASDLHRSTAPREASRHPLCCDCDDCLNGSGGLVLPGAGVTVEVVSYEATRRGLEASRLSEARYRAKKAAEKLKGAA